MFTCIFQSYGYRKNGKEEKDWARKSGRGNSGKGKLVKTMYQFDKMLKKVTAQKE